MKTYLIHGYTGGDDESNGAYRSQTWGRTDGPEVSSTLPFGLKANQGFIILNIPN
jgi:hypothetical protein